MPTYTVKDPQSGKTVKLTGDSPPTEAELTEIFAKLNTARAPTPLPAAATTGMLPNSTADDPAPDPRTAGIGNTRVRGMMDQLNTRSAELRTDAAEHPIRTAATIAAPAAIGGTAKLAKAIIPTRAHAGAKFQQVMGAVGDKPVDMGRTGDAALRIADLAQHGGGTQWGPAPVRQLIQYATDPKKPEMTYQVGREFYSNITRLSADEMQRMPPVIRKELNVLRAALNHALAKTAASGGQEQVYKAAMREYAIASRISEFAAKAAKYGAGIAGAGALYNFARD